jgi:Fe-S oxidoreductase
MEFDWFVVPFNVAAIFLFAMVGFKFYIWIRQIKREERQKILLNFFTKATLKSVKEAFVDGLLHMKIFKKNKLLGYMHMSLAFGWFLLIVVGHIETIFYEKTAAFPFHKAVFLRYYNTGSVHFVEANMFNFAMDFLLMFVLSGVALAYYKRLNKKIFGMKRTTKHALGDRIALTALWFIFPLRLLAESSSAALYQNGSFLTQSIGGAWSLLPHFELFHESLWFAYSSSLAFFFVAMPFSRYMHIPTEILYIFIRNWGINMGTSSKGVAQIEVHSCSRCGICLDRCQLSEIGIQTVQPPYLFGQIRSGKIQTEPLLNCLSCGRCEDACPVDIKTTLVRRNVRDSIEKPLFSNFNYLESSEIKTLKVIYFAGCMTHLTPSIKKSMLQILNASGLDYWFMDEHKGICCGRPLKQTGQVEAAQKLIGANEHLILESGAHLLVTSCPICYKIFNEEYHLPNVQIMHHTQFIDSLIKKGKIEIEISDQKMVYHDPCELGRGSGIFDQPREVLRLVGELLSIENEKNKADCCGGSISNLMISTADRRKISARAVQSYAQTEADTLVTSCPLCKRTFAETGVMPVLDVAEIVALSMVKPINQVTCETEYEANLIDVF